MPKRPKPRAKSAAPASASSPARILLGQNNYGKSRVRMVKVSRTGKIHTVREFSIDIALQGDFEHIHTRGDNAHCLPTDTMKNTVYALGKKHTFDTIEEFAALLCTHFLKGHAPASSATVSITEITWKRVHTRAREHPHCFLKGSDERRTCIVHMNRTGVDIASGIEGLVILKSTDSAFAGYPRDGYTTLPETHDRVFCTSMTAFWGCGFSAKPRADYGSLRESVRELLIQTFAEHKSESVQHTLYAMGETVLKSCAPIRNIRLSMPNKHYNLANLKPFGMTNNNEIFIPTDEPHGLIEATIQRK